MTTDEEIIKRLQKLRTELSKDLLYINGKHDAILTDLAEIDSIINEFEENDDA